MSDLISRQAAIDALQKEINKGIPPFDDVMGSIRCGVRLARNIIEDLPSAQSENLQPTCNQLATECISRQDAIDSLDSCGRLILPNGILYTDAVSAIKALPSAQPEPKKGKWIIRDNPGTGWYRVTCSECGEDVTSTIPMIGFFPNAKPLWDYCPYCGAKMEVEDNGKQ